MSLADINHFWGSDLSVSSIGDLSTVTGNQRGQQRILRRLFTNPGDYLAQPNYGAGILQAIGSPVDTAKLAALITAQVLLEDSVAPTPAPTVAIVPAPNDANGGALAINITYTDQPSNAPVVLAFTVTPD